MSHRTGLSLRTGVPVREGGPACIWGGILTLRCGLDVGGRVGGADMDGGLPIGVPETLRIGGPALGGGGVAEDVAAVSEPPAFLLIHFLRSGS